MKLLALDTVTEACSVALYVDGEYLCRHEVVGNGHSTRLLPMAGELLAEAELSVSQLDGIAFDRGPGSFTGVRIGAGVAQGMAFSADLPLVGVSSLETLAAASHGEVVLAAIDARMRQIYWAIYRITESAVECISPESVDHPADLRVDQQWLHGVGSGWDRYAKELLDSLSNREIGWTPGCFPSAREVARLSLGELEKGLGQLPENVVPVYIRNQVATPSPR